MKRTILLATAFTAAFLLMLGAPDAVACRPEHWTAKHAASVTVPPVTSATGLAITGTATCALVSVDGTHPDGTHALLMVSAVGVGALASIDGTGPLHLDVPVLPGQEIAVRLVGDDGDSIRTSFTVPSCAANPGRPHWRHGHR
jgi:hypothetical protein